jgi:N-dimethylarginine dimethylaminohydrolase
LPSDRFFMCRPDHFSIADEINPWMDRAVQPDAARAAADWAALVAALRGLGAEVEIVDAVPGLSDMVFAADGGVVIDERFVKGRFKYPVRQPEADHVAAWFAAHGHPVVELDLGPDAHFEGGDVRVFAGRLVVGHGVRTSLDAHDALAGALGRPLHPVRLVDPRFYHLDTSFCPLDDRHALMVPEAWDDAGRRLLCDLVPEPIALTDEEACLLCANSAVVGRTVVMHTCTPRLERALAAHDFEVRLTPVPEFVKSGAAVSCLTLPQYRL